ncbi:MAG: hypothetical protein GKR94_32600 [Gammaproteobacteria bacterium]|nr:hypothetical protein [Gammaproteobacteria bacterium]
MKITLMYAGILGLILIVLTFRVIILVRAKANLIYGDGGNPAMTPVVRAHGNFIEFVPMALILLGLIEVNGADTTLLHVLGIVLVLSRIVHPFGLQAERMNTIARFLGAASTFLMIAVASLTALWLSFG